jgi:hypothetical protein
MIPFASIVRYRGAVVSTIAIIPTIPRRRAGARTQQEKKNE